MCEDAIKCPLVSHIYATSYNESISTILWLLSLTRCALVAEMRSNDYMMRENGGHESNLADIRQ